MDHAEAEELSPRTYSVLCVSFALAVDLHLCVLLLWLPVLVGTSLTPRHAGPNCQLGGVQTQNSLPHESSEHHYGSTIFAECVVLRQRVIGVSIFVRRAVPNRSAAVISQVVPA